MSPARLRSERYAAEAWRRLPREPARLAQASWAKNSKAVALGPLDITLPRLQVQDSCAERMPLFLRFNGHPKEWPSEWAPEGLARRRARGGARGARAQDVPASGCTDWGGPAPSPSRRSCAPPKAGTRSGCPHKIGPAVEH